MPISSPAHATAALAPLQALSRGGGEAVWFLDTLVIIKQSAREGATFGLLEYQMPAHSATPRHRHLDEEEAIYVLEGDLTLHVGDERREVGQGAYVRLPAGVPHGLVAESAAKLLVFTKPDGFVSFVRAAGVPATAPILPAPGPLDAPLLEATAKRFGIEILGPLPAG